MPVYHDPVLSSKGHFVETSGLRWLDAMPIVPVPWAGRPMALPVLTALVHSERLYADSPRPPKALLDAARQMILQICRWLPGRRIVVVADSAFAAIAFLAALAPHACVVTRLRLDADLFAPAPPRRKGARGRPPLKGKRLPKLAAVVAHPATVWRPHTVALWYGTHDRAIARTTPALLGLFSLVVLWMDDLVKAKRIAPQATAWYRQTRITFADAIAAVRREIWLHQTSSTSRSSLDRVEIPTHIWSRMGTAVAHAR